MPERLGAKSLAFHVTLAKMEVLQAKNSWNEQNQGTRLGIWSWTVESRLDVEWFWFAFPKYSCLRMKKNKTFGL